MKRIRVLLADDHTLVLEGLKRLLAADFELVGMVENGRELLEVAPELKPDVVLLDISMPLLNGVDAARQLKKTRPEIKIIFLTMHAEKTYVAEAFNAGASGYLLKSSAASELVSAIQEVAMGRAYLTPLIEAEGLRPFIDRSARSSLRARSRTAGGLTARQREVLQLVAEGRANKEIAGIMKISIKTVEFHKSEIRRNLGLGTTAELTRYALQHGIAGNTD